MQTSLELALIRWSVVHRKWHELANDMPCLGAFLAGWFLRDMSPKGTQPPDVASFRDSFRVGWRESDDQITILSRPTRETMILEAVRDDVLNERGPLEGMGLDGDQINAVLAIIDDAMPSKENIGGETRA